jgi:hypothetical protein
MAKIFLSYHDHEILIFMECKKLFPIGRRKMTKFESANNLRLVPRMITARRTLVNVINVFMF